MGLKSGRLESGGWLPRVGFGGGLVSLCILSRFSFTFGGRCVVGLLNWMWCKLFGIFAEVVEKGRGF